MRRVCVIAMLMALMALCALPAMAAAADDTNPAASKAATTGSKQPAVSVMKQGAKASVATDTGVTSYRLSGKQLAQEKKAAAALYDTGGCARCKDHGDGGSREYSVPMQYHKRNANVAHKYREDSDKRPNVRVKY